jgi:hypothetical protein
MRPQEQLRLLTKIWGRGETGYVFLPWIDAKAARTSARKSSWREGTAFHWPADRAKVLDHLTKHADDDLYFAPMMFSGKGRRSDLAMKGNRLWADLDEADPRQIEEHLKPTYAWETSPGRYAAVWSMTEDRPDVTEQGMENHRLSIYLGADPSGWDTTQLLRVPGSANNKPDKPEGCRGKVLWADREIHTWDAFEALPEVAQIHTVDVDSLSEDIIAEVDRHAVWAKVRLKVSRSVREFMRMKDTGGLDRSGTSWQISRELADHGCSLAEIVAIVRPTVWNKFDGRQDELKRLMTEAAKALAQVDKNKDAAVLELEEVDDTPKPEGLVGFQSDDSFLKVPRTKWMIRDIWSENGVGFIAGAPKSMKSWLALHMAFSVSTRTDYWGHSVTRSRNVLYIQQEDDAATVKQRLGIIVDSQDDRYHWDGVMRLNDASQVTWEPAIVTPHMLSVQVQSGFIASDTGWQAWLAEMVTTHDIGLVVMDTLMTVSGGIDTDNAREIKSMMLDPLKVISRANKCAIVLVHHNTKGGQNNRGAMNMAGSGQIHAWADCGIYVHSREGNELKVEIETKFGANRTTHISLDSLNVEQGERPLWLPREVLKEESGTGEVTRADMGRGNRTPTGKKRESAAVDVFTYPDGPIDEDLTGRGLTVFDQRAIISRRVRKAVKEAMDEGVTTPFAIAKELNITKGRVTTALKDIRGGRP